VGWLENSYNLEGLWDLSQHYFGWVMYRNSPWTFPVGLLEGITAEPISVAYTDSIPLFAIFFKLLSPILPESFQYIGLFEFLCYFFMGAFSSLLTCKFTDKYWLNGISAVFFVTSPVFIKRTFYHVALSAHFLILVAICLWLYRESFSRKKYILLWTILTIISTLINPYYVPMVVGILLCSLLQEFLLERKWIYTLLAVGIPGMGALLAGWVEGLFYGSISPAAASIELVSYNLIQLFNPRNDMLYHERVQQEQAGFRFTYQSYSSFFDGWEVATPWQNEGFAYFGLGMLVLLLLVVVVGIFLAVKQKKRLSKEQRSYLWAITLGMLIFTLLALGPKAMAGKIQLYYISWPQTIYKLFSIFRTAGRLFWPVYYGLMAILLGVAYTWVETGSNKRKRHIVAAVICGCLVLQIVDLLPSFQYKAQVYHKVEKESESTGNVVTASPALQYLAEQGNEIIFSAPSSLTICNWPSWSCMFEKLAIDYGLKMNVSYCSRDASAIGDAYALENYSRREQGETFPGTIYVFLFPEEIENYRYLHLNFYQFENIFIGTDLNLDDFPDVTSY
jgi:hypothetical protein